MKSRLLILTAHGGRRLLESIQSVALIVFSRVLRYEGLGAQYSVLCFVFAGVDVVLVVVNTRVIGMDAQRYTTSQNYPKCNVDRARQAFNRGCIGIQVKRARLRISYVLMPVWLY